MDRRQEAAVPDLRTPVRQVLAEHDVRGQVLVECPQAVADPGPHAGQRHCGRAGVHCQNRLKMLDDIGMQRPDHAQLVGHATQVRKELADHQARLSAWLKLKRRAQERPVAGFVGPEPERGNRLAAVAVQPGLVVERVDMRETTGKKDHDQLPRRRGMMRRPGCEQAPASLLRRLDQPGVATRNRGGGDCGSRPQEAAAIESISPVITVFHERLLPVLRRRKKPAGASLVSRCTGIRWRSEEPGPDCSRPRSPAGRCRSRWPELQPYKMP